MARRGYHILAWDILHGEVYDLLNAKNRSLLRGWVLSRAILAVHLGTPCNSWPRAGDRPGGPPPLRSNVEIWGLPYRRPGDQVSIHIGNVTTRFTASFLFACRHMRVPASIENPATSRLWIAPPILRSLAASNVSVQVTDFCQWGASWMKATMFAACF